MIRLLLISLAGHGYIGARLIPGLAAWPLAQWLAGFVLLASAALVPSGMGRRSVRRPPTPASDRLSLVCMLMLGWFSSMFVLTLVRDVAIVLLLVADALGAPAIAFPALERWSAVAVFVLATLASILGWRNARAVPRVAEVEIAIDRLPPALDGLRITQISDLHVGPTIKAAQMRAIVDVVNRLDADFVAITGDLVDGPVQTLADDVAPLAELRSRFGSFFVTGNHEYYAGAHEWIDQVRRLGITVLMNEHVVLEHGDARIVLAGVSDFTAGHYDPAHRSDPVGALAGAPADAGVRILLAHQPRSALVAATAAYDLQLSGHTHGGQFLPWRFFVKLQQPFVAGLVRFGQLQIYISRGSGYWGPPKRIGAPSEISLIRLRSTIAPASASMPAGDRSLDSTDGALS